MIENPRRRPKTSAREKEVIDIANEFSRSMFSLNNSFAY